MSYLHQLYGASLVRPKGHFGTGGGIPPDPPAIDVGLVSGWEFERFTSQPQNTFLYRSNTPEGQHLVGQSAPLRNSGGTQAPYPVNFVVTGIPTSLASMSIRIHSILPGGDQPFGTGQDFDSIGFILVGPAGQKILLVADCGGAGFISAQGTPGVTLNFATGAGGVPDGTAPSSATYRPTKGSTASPGSAVPANFYSPAPAGPYSLSLVDFNGTDPNGTWSLYGINDTSTQDTINAGGRYSYAELTLITAASVNITDVVGANHLSSVNNPTIVAGKIGNAFRLTGTQAVFLTAPKSDSLSLTPLAPDVLEHYFITIAFWYKPTSINVSQPCVMMDYGYACYLNSNNKFRVIYDTDADLVEFSSVTAVAGNWHFVVFGWSPLGVDRRGWISVNGGEKVFGTNIGAPSPATGPFAVGRYTSSAINLGNSNGDFDELFSWRRELTSNEITYLYNNGDGRRFPWQTFGLTATDILSQATDRLMATDSEPLVGP